MIKYFFGKRFNFNEFLWSERVIMNQWDDLAIIDKMNEKELINRFSLFMCHISDELKEVFDAYNRENYLQEIIDVMMYTASAMNLFVMKEYCISKELRDEVNDYDIESMSSYKTNLPSEINIPEIIDKFNLDNLTASIMRNCSLIREKFPQRKWHKENNSFKNIVEFSHVCEECSQICLSIIKTIIIYLTSRESDYELLNDYINAKQLKIITDGIMNGRNTKSLNKLKEKILFEEE